MRLAMIVPILLGSLACSGGDSSSSENGGTSTDPGTGGGTSAGGGVAGGGGTGGGGAGGGGGTSGGGTGGGANGGGGMGGGAVDAGVILPPGPTGCGLASAAFCDTFDAPAPGGNAGELDESKWGMSRWGIGYNHTTIFHRPLASTVPGYTPQATLCGAPFSNIAVGQDLRVCAGKDASGAASNQLQDVMQDGGDNIYINSMMIRRPFDFAGRTGTLVLDVDARVLSGGDGHGWWNEIWISEDPTPTPYQRNLPSVDSIVRNSVGIEFHNTGRNGDCDISQNRNGVTGVFVTSQSGFRSVNFNATTCFKTQDSVLNHLEIKVSKTTIEVFASDAGQPSTLRKIASASNLNLAFERGFLSLQHTHYNAAKFKTPDSTPSQVYRWDNVGFDGPVRPFLRAYEPPPNVRVQDGASFHGYTLPTAPISFSGVDLTGMSKAHLNLTVFPTMNVQYRINGGAWQTYNDPVAGAKGDYKIRSMSIPLSLQDLKAGTNTVEVKNAGSVQNVDNIGNVDLTLE